MAAFFIAFASVAIPLGVVILIERSGWETTALWLIWAGIVSFAIGLGFTFREEAEKRRNAEQQRQDRERDDRWREGQDEKRDVEHVEYLATLRIIAKRLGANSVITKRQVEREGEHFREERKRKKSEESSNEL